VGAGTAGADVPIALLCAREHSFEVDPAGASTRGHHGPVAGAWQNQAVHQLVLRNARHLPAGDHPHHREGQAEFCGEERALAQQHRCESTTNVAEPDQKQFEVRLLLGPCQAHAAEQRS
jgi:hypothetical protein